MTVEEMIEQLDKLIVDGRIHKDDPVSIYYDNGIIDRAKEVSYFIEPRGLVIKS